MEADDSEREDSSQPSVLVCPSQSQIDLPHTSPEIDLDSDELQPEDDWDDYEVFTVRLAQAVRQ